MEKLKEAIALIAYDSGVGMANTTERTEAMLEKVQQLYSGPQLSNMEHFLGGLTEDEFETVCIGGITEAKVILERDGGWMTSEALDYVFEGDHGL